MTTKTISTTVFGGYVLAPQYDALDITPTGKILGNGGLQLNHQASVVNDGVIQSGYPSANGVTSIAGASIDNAGRIVGYSGVFAQNASASVVNDNYIHGQGRYGDGVFLTAGGTVTNGSTHGSGAYILGDNNGVAVGGAALVDNFGTIIGQYGQGVELGGAGESLYNKLGGHIIGAAGGARSDGADGQISNGGEIIGVGAGVYFKSGGVLNNFGAVEADGTNTTAVAFAAGAGTVLNSGLISSYYGAGVQLSGGGSVISGGTLYAAAGYFGVIISGGAGALTNGSASLTGATIQGAVYLNGGGQLANFGTINGDGLTGVYVQSGSLTNGAAGTTGALIEGYYLGARTGANTTVTNFGTIEGAGGFAPKAVELGASSTLVVEAGSAFIGQVLGDGGILILADGAGTLGLLAGDTQTVSGSMALTTFSNFAIVEVAATASFATAGSVTIAVGQSIIDSGVLVLGAKKNPVANASVIEVLAGTLTVKGNVTGKGSAVIGGGLLDFTMSFGQNVAFTGATGTLELGQSQAYGGAITGFSQAGGTLLDLADIGFTGKGEASFSGNKRGGVLTVSDGTHTAAITLVGNYTKSNFTASKDGHGGTIVADTKAQASATISLARPAPFAAAMAAVGPITAWAEPAGTTWRRSMEPLLSARASFN